MTHSFVAVIKKSIFDTDTREKEKKRKICLNKLRQTQKYHVKVNIFFFLCPYQVAHVARELVQSLAGAHDS